MQRKPLKLFVFWKRFCKILDPADGFVLCLFYQCPHGQAINEPARPIRNNWRRDAARTRRRGRPRYRILNTIPKPGEHHRSSFAKPRWDVDELRMAVCATEQRFNKRTAGKATLILVGRIACGSFEKFGECHSMKGVAIMILRLWPVALAQVSMTRTRWEGFAGTSCPRPN